MPQSTIAQKLSGDPICQRQVLPLCAKSCHLQAGRRWLVSTRCCHSTISVGVSGLSPSKTFTVMFAGGDGILRKAAPWLTPPFVRVADRTARCTTARLRLIRKRRRNDDRGSAQRAPRGGSWQWMAAGKADAPRTEYSHALLHVVRHPEAPREEPPF